MDDSLLRQIVEIAALLAALAYLWGGFTTHVAGSWLDGEQFIELHQLGPWVWGESQVQGGRQVFRGRASWGSLRLSRLDYGGEHLLELGFSRQQLPALQGKVMATLRLKIEGDTLVGLFFGQRFSFEEGRLRRMARLQPSTRRWVRQD